MIVKKITAVTCLSLLAAMTACEKTEKVEATALAEGSVNAENQHPSELNVEPEYTPETVIAQALPDEAPTMDEKLGFSASVKRTVTSKVLEIDHETRLVTLAGPNEETIIFTASDEARNLKQVQAGDIVIAEYEQSVAVSVVTAEAAEPAVAAITARIRSEEGDMPGVAAVESTVEVYTVEEINIEKNTFKLKDVTGTITEYIAENPEHLKKADPGNTVIVTTTEAVAISVEPAPAE